MKRDNDYRPQVPPTHPHDGFLFEPATRTSDKILPEKRQQRLFPMPKGR